MRAKRLQPVPDIVIVSLKLVMPVMLGDTVSVSVTGIDSPAAIRASWLVQVKVM